LKDHRAIVLPVEPQRQAIAPVTPGILLHRPDTKQIVDPAHRVTVTVGVDPEKNVLRAVQRDVGGPARIHDTGSLPALPGIGVRGEGEENRGIQPATARGKLLHFQIIAAAGREWIGVGHKALDVDTVGDDGARPADRHHVIGTPSASPSSFEICLKHHIGLRRGRRKRL